MGITMASEELETGLVNRIEQSRSAVGRPLEGVSRSIWIAARFAEWRRGRVGGTMADAERVASSLRQELMRPGGWGRPERLSIS